MIFVIGVDQIDLMTMKFARVFDRTVILDLLAVHVKPSEPTLLVKSLKSVVKSVTFFNMILESFTLLGFDEILIIGETS